MTPALRKGPRLSWSVNMGFAEFKFADTEILQIAQNTRAYYTSLDYFTKSTTAPCAERKLAATIYTEKNDWL